MGLLRCVVGFYRYNNFTRNITAIHFFGAGQLTKREVTLCARAYQSRLPDPPVHDVHGSIKKVIVRS